MITLMVQQDQLISSYENTTPETDMYVAQ